jgi:hypothetical protein
VISLHNSATCLLSRQTYRTCIHLHTSFIQSRSKPIIYGHVVFDNVPKDSRIRQSTPCYNSRCTSYCRRGHFWLLPLACIRLGTALSPYVSRRHVQVLREDVRRHHPRPRMRRSGSRGFPTERTKTIRLVRSSNQVPNRLSLNRGNQ